MIPHDICFYCIAIGVLLTLAAQEVGRGFREWRDSMWEARDGR